MENITDLNGTEWLINEVFTFYTIPNNSTTPIPITGIIGSIDIDGNPLQRTFNSVQLYRYNTTATIGFMFEGGNQLYYSGDKYGSAVANSGYIRISIDGTTLTRNSDNGDVFDFMRSVKFTSSASGATDTINQYLLNYVLNNFTYVVPTTPTKKLTRLYIGGVVASSGGKCFKRLSTIMKLLAPTISISDGIVSITNNNDVSVRYNVFINGENYAGTTVDATTVDLTSFALEAGTYSVYLTAFADGYEESEQSNAVEYVVEESVPTDLTGYTVTVPAGWSASKSFGSYYLKGVLNTNFPFKTTNNPNVYIGYKYGTLTPTVNTITFYNTFTTSNPHYYDNTKQLVFNISGGTGATEPSLIQWFVDNNATFKKTT